MNLLTIIALVMITLVGYSSGITLAGQKRHIEITIFDLVIVMILWVAAFMTRSTLGHWWSILVWLLVAIVTGFIKTIMLQFDTVDLMPESELPEHAIEAVAEEKIGLLRRIWRGWSRFAEKMGNVQGRLLMGFFYFLIVTPFAIPYSMFNDPMNVNAYKDEDMHWLEKEAIDLTLNQAREQG